MADPPRIDRPTLNYLSALGKNNERDRFNAHEERCLPASARSRPTKRWPRGSWMTW